MHTILAWPPADRLSEYVTESNLVDYGRLAAQEKEWLAPVISSIKSNNPTETNAERHAFLINAYNLWTLHYVIRERRFPGFKGAVSTLAKARFFYWHKVSTGAGRWNLYNFENKVGRVNSSPVDVVFELPHTSSTLALVRAFCQQNLLGYPQLKLNHRRWYSKEGLRGKHG